MSLALILFSTVCVRGACVSIYEYEYLQMLLEARACGSFGAGVREGCELPDVGAGK